MPRVRRKLEIDEVSLVKRGANPGARVALYKNAERVRLETATNGLTKAVAYAAIRAKAVSLRKDGETREQAIARYLVTDEGRASLAVCHRAPGPWIKPAQPVKKAASCPSVQAVHEKAAELRKEDPTLTEHQARARVWMSNPELRRRYDEERSLRIDKLVA